MPGRVPPSRLLFRDDQVAGFAGGLPGSGGSEAFFDDALGIIGVLFKVKAKPVVDDAFHDALDLGIAQLAFGLAFKLRLGELDADDGRQAFADIIAGQVGFIFLDQLVLAGIIIQDAGQGGTETGQVGAAVDGIDAVGEAVNGFAE